LSPAQASRVSTSLNAREARAPVLALSVEEACEALGVSWKTWREHIEPDLKVIRIGRCKRISVTELERWCDEHGENVDA
jgi:excisionase family DNA binding protein